MSGKPRSVRQAQALQAAQLRSIGRSWAEIAAVFQSTYRVNPRVALRQAHGWSQPQAAAHWTTRWPDDPKTFKNFSYWEQWPGRTGHAPSLDTLDRLAQLYECKLTDLLADCADYGKHGSAVNGAVPDMPAHVPTAHASPASPSTVTAERLRAALDTIRRAGIDDLTSAATGTDQPSGRLRSRTLLLEASVALAVVAAAPVLEVPRLIAPRTGQARGDLGVVSYAGEVVAGLRRLGGSVGPRIILPPAMALRSAMAALGRAVPEMVTSEALTAYADLTQLVGWLMFNLGDIRAARYYYDDARAAGYRAGNNDLVAYALAATSQLAISRGRLRTAIDHAQAARQTAKASSSLHAQAYAHDLLAQAHAAAGQVARARSALDREEELVSLIRDDTPRSPWWYFYDTSFYLGTQSECGIKFGAPVFAVDAARRALDLIAPLNLHNSAMTHALLAEARIMQGEIEHACVCIADAAELATMNSSARISHRIVRLRGQLGFAEGTAALRELDEKLADFRRARSAEPTADGSQPATAGESR